MATNHLTPQEKRQQDLSIRMDIYTELCQENVDAILKLAHLINQNRNDPLPEHFSVTALEAYLKNAFYRGLTVGLKTSKALISGD